MKKIINTLVKNNSKKDCCILQTSRENPKNHNQRMYKFGYDACKEELIIEFENLIDKAYKKTHTHYSFYNQLVLDLENLKRQNKHG